MVVSTIFEGYLWTGMTIAGMVLAVIGMVIALRSKMTSKQAG